MRKLRIGVIDLVAKAPMQSLWARIMFPNFASIMPQVLATWCEQEGHDVTLVCYTGFENLVVELPANVDIVFIGGFTHAAQLAYALSNIFRSKGVITALGGPHARSYPEDAQKYFDYVLGFTDQQVLHDVLSDCSPHRPVGVHLSAERQPAELPGVRERWKFIEPTLSKAPFVKIVAMIGSLGCPYTCSFCVDSVVPYQPLDFDTIKGDLRFLRTKFKRPKVGWHDPNFGVRFHDYLNVIEEAVPPGSIDFFAESSLSLLSEENLKRLRHNGFRAILPGIESWFDVGNKSKTGKKYGMDKVRHVADHLNLVMQYVPYVQANLLFGCDADEGALPYECTKAFVDQAPGAYPGYCQLTAFGRSAPLNLEYQRAGRVLPHPFHLLSAQFVMNVRPKHYGWIEFYKHLIDVTQHTFSYKAIYNRYRAINAKGWRWMNVLRGMSSQGRGRVNVYRDIVHRLETDKAFRAFYEQETTDVPQYYLDQIREELGDFWDWLPAGALYHDPYAFLKTHMRASKPHRSATLPRGRVAPTPTPTPTPTHNTTPTL